MTTATTNPSPTEFSPKRILVVGSSVLDNVVRVDEFPKPGESVIARSKETFLGGKGCNQAVAAARLGAEVTFTTGAGRGSATLAEGPLPLGSHPGSLSLIGEGLRRRPWIS